SGLVPLRSPQNPAGTSRRALLPRRAVGVAFRTLTNHRPSLTPLRVDCKALWRCGIYAAEALSSGGKLQDATSSEVIQRPRWVMGMFDGRGLEFNYVGQTSACGSSPQVYWHYAVDLPRPGRNRAL